MPTVGGKGKPKKHFAYDKKGVAAAKKEAEATNQPMMMQPAKPAMPMKKAGAAKPLKRGGKKKGN